MASNSVAVAADPDVEVRTANPECIPATSRAHPVALQRSQDLALACRRAPQEAGPAPWAIRTPVAVSVHAPAPKGANRSS